MSDRIRIAFVKHAGMTAGGTERWLQVMATALPRDRFDVTYFWSDAAPAIGRPGMVGAATEPSRVAHVEAAGIPHVHFHVGAVDLRHPHFPWQQTDFWDVFRPTDYDLVQTTKQGRPEYPYTEMTVPVFEQVAYNGGVDRSPAIVRSGHPSEWSRAWWWRRGGDARRSFVLPIPTAAPATDDDLRSELGVGPDELVVGFHQRRDDATMSEVQLAALSRLRRGDVHLVVLGGSTRYQDQARRLGLPNAHFLPPSSDALRISSFLNTLDVFIHGRRDGETFGLVLAEALAHGLPCISHRVLDNGNAQRETIGPGGLVVDDVAGYADTLAELLKDPDARRLLSARGRAHATDRYALAPAVQGLAEEYKAFLSRRSPPARRSYGEVPGGALLSGVVLDSTSPAHGVLTGVAPFEPLSTAVVSAFRSGAAGRLLCVGSGLAPIALSLLVQQRTSTLVVAEPDPAARADWCALLQLNGVDGRATVRDSVGPLAGEVSGDAVVVARGPSLQRAGVDAASLRRAHLALVADCPADLREALVGATDVTVGGWRWTIAGAGVEPTKQSIRSASRDVRRRHLRTLAGRRWFPVRQLVGQWAQAVAQAALARVHGHPPVAAPEHAGLAIHHGDHPGATGQHLAEAAERIGAGSGLPMPHRSHLQLASLQASAYLWVESGKTSLPVGAHLAPFPTGGYLIDAHVHPDLSRLQAQLFDVVFVAQKDLMATVANDHPNAVWLPLAAPAAFLDVVRASRFDAGFVGNVFPGTHRERILQAVESAVRMNSWRLPHLPAEMAQVYAGSRVVVNPPANGDLNMRFFEALACGAVVVTAPIGNGQADLGVEGRDFVVADFADPLAVAAAVAATVASTDPPGACAERRSLIADGHTYDHRVRTIVRAMDDAPRQAPVRSLGDRARARLLADLADAYEDAGLLAQAGLAARGRGLPPVLPLTAGRVGRRVIIEILDTRAPGASGALRRRRRR